MNGRPVASSDPWSPSLARRLDQVCLRFEAAWKAGQRPRIEEFLGDAPEQDRPPLLGELIPLDVAYRRRCGEDPQPEEYQARFPGLDPVWLARVVLASSQGELDLATSPGVSAQVAAGAGQPWPHPICCPHCHHPTQRIDGDAAEMLCPGCGDSFRVRDAWLTTTDGPACLLGKFQLVERVGVGAFGAVWCARDTELDRIVALKIPHAGVLAAPGDLERFHREARAAAQLRHPGIVTVHEVTTLGGLPVLVSEFVAGVSLKNLLQVRRLTFREAARLVAEVAEALDYAHAQGLVHRDIKPANIMVEPGRHGADDPGSAAANGDGAGKATEVLKPLLMDFGLALRAEAEVTLTLDGEILGTPAYMSPEQAAGQGHRVDRRGDVYSLGVVLYELLTGELPFRGSRAMLVHQVLYEEPRPARKLNDKVPRDLETVCLKAMAKAPGRRYQTARDLADDLRRFLKGEPIRARPVGRGEKCWRWCRRNPALAAASALAAAAVLAVTAVSVLFAVHKAEALRESEDNRLRLGEEQGRTMAALEKSEKTRRQLEETDGRRREALRQSALLALDRGLDLCEKGKVDQGLLWLARGLEIAPADAADVQYPLRANLAGWRRALHTLRAAFPHENMVTAVAISPDGRTILTASQDKTARLWEAATGKPLGQPLRPEDVVMATAFSPDGRAVLTVSRERSQLWEVVTGKLLQTFAHQTQGTVLGRPGEQARGHHEAVTVAAFSPDGRFVLTGSYDRTARLWEAATGKPMHTLPHRARVTAAAFSPDSRFVLTGSGELLVEGPGEARLWEAATGKPMHTLPHQAAVTAVAFSADGRFVLTGSQDKTARLWEAATGKLLHTLSHENHVWAVAFSPDGRTALTGSEDNAACLWDAAAGKRLHTLPHQDTVAAVAFSPDGRTVLTASQDKTARLWEAATGKPLGQPLPAESTGTRDGYFLAVAFSPDGRFVLTGSPDKTVRLWEVAAGQPLGQLLPLKEHARAVAFSPDGRLVLTVGPDKTARLWEANTGKPFGRPFTHPAPLGGAAFGPDGRTVLTVGGTTVCLWEAATGQPLQTLQQPAPVTRVVISPDGQVVLTGSGKAVRLWDAATGKLLRAIEHPAPVMRAAFSPDGQTLATEQNGGPVRLWDTATGQLLHTLARDLSVSAFAFSPDGRTALTGSGKAVRLWDAATGKPLRAIEHPASVRRAAFSPDGRTVLTASYDKTVRLWDAATGKPVGPPLVHEYMPTAAFFGPGGRTVLTTSWDVARLWDAATGRPIGQPLPHQTLMGIEAAAFGPGGRTVLTTSRDAVRLWELPVPLEGEVEPIALWTRVLTGMEMDAQGAVHTLDARTWHELRRRLEELGGPSPASEQLVTGPTAPPEK